MRGARVVGNSLVWGQIEGEPPVGHLVVLPNRGDRRTILWVSDDPSMDARVAKLLLAHLRPARGLEEEVFALVRRSSTGASEAVGLLTVKARAEQGFRAEARAAARACTVALDWSLLQEAASDAEAPFETEDTPSEDDGWPYLYEERAGTVSGVGTDPHAAIGGDEGRW